jgi:tripeptide aminopeptidase
MNKIMLQSLLDTLRVQTKTYDTYDMNQFIIKELNKIEGVTHYMDDGNIYAVRGKADSYPCVVAHTDTVHEKYDNFHIFELGDLLFSIDGNTMQRVGIGGDDKVGIFVALECIKTLDVCKVAFFRDEEHGCLGSAEADMKFFKGCEFVLQCDRQGYKDFVNDIYGCKLFSDEFSELIAPTLKKYGRKEEDGGLTDVYQLVENGLGSKDEDSFNLCVANMSCGYYRPHSDDEFVSVSQIEKTLNMVLEICEVAKGKIWTISDHDRYASEFAKYGVNDLDDNDEGRWNNPNTRTYVDGFGLDGSMDGDDFHDEEKRGNYLNHDIDNCPDCNETTQYDDHEEAPYCMGCQSYIYGTDVEGEFQVVSFNDIDYD